MLCQETQTDHENSRVSDKGRLFFMAIQTLIMSFICIFTVPTLRFWICTLVSISLLTNSCIISKAYTSTYRNRNWSQSHPSKSNECLYLLRINHYCIGNARSDKRMLVSEQNYYKKQEKWKEWVCLLILLVFNFTCI